MRLIRGINNLKPEHRGCVVTIGNFDGMHLGHQALLRRLQKKAGELNLPETLVTFNPYPLEYFLQKKAAARLMRMREKIEFLQGFGIERVLCLPFNKKLSQMSAEDFIERVLKQGLDAKYILVGDDFRFGHKRQGDVKMLRDAGFDVEEMSTFESDDERISSTRVRKALEVGEMTLAEKLLGHSYKMWGRVAHGDKQGRVLGFPTANIYLHRKAVPVEGIFAVNVHGLSNEPLKGVAYVGTRPAVNGTRTVLEAHIFDFDKTIYGRYVGVEFVCKLRDDKKFDSLDELKKQISLDSESARGYFKKINRQDARSARK